MGMISITQDEAKFAHQSFYDGEFEILQIMRSGPFDYFPFSMFYALSDMGSWNGLMSTDGNKIVITRSKYLDLAKAKKTYEFDVDKIESSKFGTFKVTLKINEKIKGITKSSSLILRILNIALKFMIVGLFFEIGSKGQQFQARIETSNFDNSEKFEALISK